MSDASRTAPSTRNYASAAIVAAVCVAFTAATAWSFGVWTPAWQVWMYVGLAVLAGLLIPARSRGGWYKWLWRLRNAALVAFVFTVIVDIAYGVLFVAEFGAARG